MMTEAAELTPHLNDAELVRYIDEEGHALERARWRRHVEACPACAHEVALLGDQALFVSDWLARATDAAPVPAAALPAGAAVRSFDRAAPRRPATPTVRAPGGARRWHASAPWLRAAAAVVLLAAPVAAYPPLRGWVGDRLGIGAGGAPQEARPMAMATDATAPSTSLRFVPLAGAFTVEIDAAPTAGTLTLGRAAGDEATLDVIGGGAVRPIVSELRVRIDAPANAGASYVLRVPAGVSAVTVRIAGQPPRTVNRAELDAGVVVPLAR